MKALVIFDPHYNGAPADAVWIIESPENRIWFQQHAQSIDQNSAVFNADSDLLTIIWNVFDHHPKWTDIEVSGRSLTKEVAHELASDADLTMTKCGFSLTRH